MQKPICPKCGCPARLVKMIAKVLCELNTDGTFGKVVQACKAMGEPQYICGGGHKWNEKKT